MLPNFWLPLASALFWAVCVSIDTVMMRQVMRNARVAIFLNSLFSVWGFIVIPIAGQFITVDKPDSLQIGMAILAGGLWVRGMYCYFAALDTAKSPAIVGAWGASYPVWTALMTLPFVPALVPHQWIGMLIVFLSLYALKGGGKIREEHGKLFQYVIFTSGHFALMALAAKTPEQYWGLYPWYLSSVVVAGFSTLVLRTQRKELWENRKILASHWLTFLAMEMLNILALLCQTVSPAMGGHPALITSIGSTFPTWIVLAEPALRKTRWAEHFPVHGSRTKKITTFLLISLGIALLLWK